MPCAIFLNFPKIHQMSFNNLKVFPPNPFRSEEKDKCDLSEDGIERLCLSLCLNRVMAIVVFSVLPLLTFMIPALSYD